MKKVFLISILFLSLFSLSAAESKSSLQIVTANKSNPASPEVTLKLSMSDTANYHMGFTQSTEINDSVVSLTQVNLIPEFYDVNSDNTQFSIKISDTTKTIRGYWNIFGNQAFEISLKLSAFTGTQKARTSTLNWSATWTDSDNNSVTANGGGESKSFYKHDSNDIEDVGSKLITFALLNSTNMSDDDLVVDKYTGTLTMEVKTLS